MNGIIKRHFGKLMATDTKLRLHNITSKASLCYGSEKWTIQKRDAQNLEAAQMRFLRPLLGLTRLGRQRNPDISNRLNVDNIEQDNTVSKEMVMPPGANGEKSPTEDGFQVPTSGTASRLGGVVVSVHATGPKGRVFKPG
jgi:hypothetical protein